MIPGVTATQNHDNLKGPEWIVSDQVKFRSGFDYSFYHSPFQHIDNQFNIVPKYFF